MFNFLHTYTPEPILATIGPVHIYWYGLLIVLGMLAAIFITIKLGSYYAVKKDTVIDLSFWLIVFGIIGARAYDVLLELPYFIKNPLDIFKVWQGGLAIHGALLGGIITLYIFSKKSPLIRGDKGGFWLLASIITPGLALAQAIGRWGNYFNQELFGRPTNLPWGITIDILNRPMRYINHEYFHPTFLYESLGNLFIFLLLICLHLIILKKIKKSNIENLKFKIENYYVLHVTCYMTLYSLLRFFLEFIRIDEAPTAMGLRWPQIISLMIIFVSIFVLLKKKNTYDSINYDSRKN